MNVEEIKATGTQVHYYVICKRKLWLHTHQISLEVESDLVLQGKILHETSYKRKESKEVLLGELIKIDLYDDEYIGEVKSSSKMKEADMAQLLYYLYFLKRSGIERKGRLHYPKEKRTEEICLTEADEEKVRAILIGIEEISSLDKPPKIKKLPYCSKCAYYNFCWVGEE